MGFSHWHIVSLDLVVRDLVTAPCPNTLAYFTARPVTKEQKFYNIDLRSQYYKNFFPSSLTMRPNELEGLSLETLSSQVLEFEGKARANPIGAPSYA